MDEKRKKIEEMRAKRQQQENQLATANKANLMATSTTKKVEDIIEIVKKKNALNVNEEIMRNPEQENVLAPQHRTSKISNTIAIYSFADSIIGKPPETFFEEIQCNLYEEINAEIEQKIEEEKLNLPQKNQERNYSYMKKVSYFTLVESNNKNSRERY